MSICVLLYKGMGLRCKSGSPGCWMPQGIRRFSLQYSVCQLETTSLGKHVHRIAWPGWCLKCDWQTSILHEQLLRWSLMSYPPNPLPLHFTIWVFFNGQGLFSGAAEKCGNCACLHTCTCFYPFWFQGKTKSLSLLNPKMVSLVSQLFMLLTTRHNLSDSFPGSQGWVPCPGAP